MRKIIYFDMDGVLVDFYSRAKEIQATSKTQFWKQVSQIGLSFWTTMEEVKGIKDIILSLDLNDIEVNILSKLPITDTANALAGKALWLSQHYPNIFTHVILTKGNKRAFAKNCLLIDDKETNVESWNLKGGKAYLFKGDIKELTEVIKNYLKECERREIYQLEAYGLEENK